QGLTAKSNEMLADAVANYHNRIADVPAVAGPQAAAGEAPQAQLERLLGPGADQSNLPQTIPNTVNFGAGEGPPVHPMTGAALGEPVSIPPIPPGEGMAMPPLQAREQVAQAIAQQPMQGPVSPGTPARARTPEERQQALIDLMANPHPQVARLGQFLQSAQDRQAAQDENLAVRREGIAANTELRKSQIEANMTNTQALIDSRESIGKDANDLRKQLATQDAELKKLQIQQTGS